MFYLNETTLNFFIELFDCFDTKLFKSRVYKGKQIKQSVGNKLEVQLEQYRTKKLISSAYYLKIKIKKF